MVLGRNEDCCRCVVAVRATESAERARRPGSRRSPARHGPSLRAQRPTRDGAAGLRSSRAGRLIDRRRPLGGFHLFDLLQSFCPREEGAHRFGTAVVTEVVGRSRRNVERHPGRIFIPLNDPMAHYNVPTPCPCGGHKYERRLSLGCVHRDGVPCPFDDHGIPTGPSCCSIDVRGLVRALDTLGMPYLARRTFSAMSRDEAHVLGVQLVAAVAEACSRRNGRARRRCTLSRAKPAARLSPREAAFHTQELRRRRKGGGVVHQGRGHGVRSRVVVLAAAEAATDRAMGLADRGGRPGCRRLTSRPERGLRACGRSCPLAAGLRSTLANWLHAVRPTAVGVPRLLLRPPTPASAARFLLQLDAARGHVACAADASDPEPRPRAATPSSRGSGFGVSFTRNVGGIGSMAIPAFGLAEEVEFAWCLWRHGPDHGRALWWSCHCAAELNLSISAKTYANREIEAGGEGDVDRVEGRGPRSAWDARGTVGLVRDLPGRRQARERHDQDLAIHRSSHASTVARVVRERVAWLLAVEEPLVADRCIASCGWTRRHGRLGGSAGLLSPATRDVDLLRGARRGRALATSYGRSAGELLRPPSGSARGGCLRTPGRPSAFSPRAGRSRRVARPP